MTADSSYRTAVAVILMTIAAPAQAIWTELSPTTSPSARAEAAMVYDAARDQVLLFGGGGDVFHGDTWVFDGSDWNELFPANAPSARFINNAMAYDSDRQRVILFGGGGLASSFGSDTWEWDGSNWTERFPATVPPGRRAHSMAYDASRQRVVLFGGFFSGGLGDTWEYDGNTWTERFPTTSPTPRYAHGMVYDSVRERIVLFGGDPQSSPRQSDVWEWDGSNWIERTPASGGPSGRSGFLTFDSHRGRTVLFGGSSSTGFLGDTWEWDGSEWMNRPYLVGPPARTSHSMAYDSSRRRVVLFGGAVLLGGPLGSPSPVGDTWEYWVNPVASSYEQFGTGCAGTAGTPVLAPASVDQLPWVAETFELTIEPIPLSGVNVPFGLLGFSASSWASFELPRDLGGYGLPGCTQYISIEFSGALANAGGTASWQIPIPNDPRLVGLTFFAQALVLDVQGPQWAVVSNAGQGLIGAR